MDSYQRSLSDMSKRMLGQQSKAVDDSNPPGSPTAKVQPLPTTTTTTTEAGSGDNKQRTMPPPYPGKIGSIVIIHPAFIISMVTN